MSDTKLTSAGFAAQMCARIAHDLISPIAALGTAIEVLDDPDNIDMHGDAIELVKLSARQASGKLQFLRLAFGAGGSAPGVIAVDELKKLTDGIYGDAKAEIIWNTDRDGIEKDAVKLTLSGKMPEDGFDGRTIQPFYAGMILRELGGKIAAGADEERVIFSAKIPHN